MNETIGTAVAVRSERIIDQISILDAYQYCMGYEATTNRMTNGYMVLCPVKEHNDTRPSCVLATARKSWRCFSCGEKGGIFRLVIASGMAKTMAEAALFLEKAHGISATYRPQPSPKPQHLVGNDLLLEKKFTDKYDYEDENRNLLYRVIRYDGIPAIEGGRSKTFDTLSKTPEGTFIRHAKNIRKIPYLLPDIVENSHKDKPEPILVFEGEGKANIMKRMGFVTTSGFGGANWQWPTAWSRFFDGVPYVVHFADSDKVGRRIAKEHATLLRKPGRDCIVVDLYPNKDDGSDIIDWLKEAKERGIKRSEAKEEIEKIIKIQLDNQTE